MASHAARPCRASKEDALPRGDGWWVRSRADRSGRVLVLRYRDGERWRDHRLPQDARTAAQITAYVRVFLRALDDERTYVARRIDNPTFQEFGERWTTGQLAREYPDQVRAKRSAQSDAGMLRKHVYPVIGSIKVASVTLDQLERVMARLPDNLQPNTRRNIAICMHRLLSLSVYPARLRESNPLPRGFVPLSAPNRPEVWLYPEEEMQLIGCASVPLAHRVLYGVLAREGMRVGEATALSWRNIDLVRGTVSIDENKTDDPRMWPLGPDVFRSIIAYRDRFHGKFGPDDPVVPTTTYMRFDADGENTYARQFRRHLRIAGIDRADLFCGDDPVRIPIRLHDLRATFVTVAIACGKSDRWVRDRTGHRSTYMLDRYRRSARTAEELGVGWFAPMDRAIPELRSACDESDVARDVASIHDAACRDAQKCGVFDMLESSCSGEYKVEVLAKPTAGPGPPRPDCANLRIYRTLSAIIR